MRALIMLVLITTSLPVHANRESGGRNYATAVFLNFNSPGSGIDQQTLYVANELIKQAVQYRFLNEQTINWRGREGEMTLCLHFRGGNPSGVSASRNFIKAIVPSMIQDTSQQGRQRTAVLLGPSCKSIETATEQDIFAYLDTDLPQ